MVSAKKKLKCFKVTIIYSIFSLINYHILQIKEPFKSFPLTEVPEFNPNKTSWLLTFD